MICLNKELYKLCKVKCKLLLRDKLLSRWKSNLTKAKHISSDRAYEKHTYID